MPPPHGIILSDVTLSHQGKSTRLTRTEATLIAALLARIGRTCTYDHLMDAVYGDRPNDIPNQETLKVYAYNLRRRLPAIGLTLVCEWGVGYCLEHPNVPTTRYESVTAFGRQTNAIVRAGGRL